jgi:fermentation-respiration switch protein FrsA (DUF1100 family)
MRARGGRLPDGFLGAAALGSRILGTLRDLALAIVVGYVAIAALMWFAQERLMFFPRAAPARVDPPPGWQLEELRLTTRDGAVLAGVLVRPPVPGRAPLVIYFGGNAEEVTESAAAAGETYGDRAVLLVNYRGYGASGGTPGEKPFVADAAEIFDWASARPDVDPTRVALHGRSLGSGVAVQLAAARPARCVVLTSPFASALEVARGAYPWLPVALLMRHPFESIAHAKGLTMPLLVLFGTGDNIVAPEQSERLAAAWGGPVERVRLEGFGHNDLSVSPAYEAAIKAFLQRCL